MPAIKSILLHLDGSSRCELRLKAACQLARQHRAELRALYAAAPQALQLPSFDGLSVQLQEELRAADDAQRSAARSMFDRVIADQSQPAIWLDPLDALSIREFSRHALYADLVVLGQREREDQSGRGVSNDFVETVLIESGKPVLVIPYIGVQDSIARTVMIAWKETRETARAVAGAMPMLREAERVHIVTWGDEHVPEGRRTKELASYLARHAVRATLHQYGDETGSIGEYILSAAADLEADLLLMGAYGHSRAREWVLGGATRTILGSMTVPVLMAH